MHMPKAAGNSIKWRFRHPEVILERLKQNNFLGYRFKTISHNLRSKNYLSLEKYLEGKPRENFYVFSFVRNPWDRVVSSFFYLNKGGIRTGEDKRDREKYIHKYNGDFGAFVRDAFLTNEIFQQIHFRPQYEWITNENGDLLTDFIGRHENLQRDFDFLCDTIGFPKKPLGHTNTSKHDNYKKYYTSETSEIIRKAYKKDIELFGYSFE